MRSWNQHSHDRPQSRTSHIHEPLTFTNPSHSRTRTGYRNEGDRTTRSRRPFGVEEGGCLPCGPSLGTADDGDSAPGRSRWCPHDCHVRPSTRFPASRVRFQRGRVFAEEVECAVVCDIRLGIRVGSYVVEDGRVLARYRAVARQVRLVQHRPTGEWRQGARIPGRHHSARRADVGRR